MRIIVFNGLRAATATLQITPIIWLGIFFLFSSVAFGLFHLGMKVGVTLSDESNATMVWYAEIDRQRQELIFLKDDMSRYVDGVAGRLSKLQGHMIRLDALGGRLAKMAGIEDIHFDNTEPLGMGGVSNTALAEPIGLRDFLNMFEEMEQKITDRNDKLVAMESMLINRNVRAQMSPTGWPIVQGWLSSLYGQRTDPISGRLEHHSGVDFAGKEGSSVVTVGSGIVTFSGEYKGYGKMIEISHNNDYMTRYAHNSENLVVLGQRVDKGQQIAKMGSSGRSTGPHVHFEVLKNRKAINPKRIIEIQ